MKNAKDNFDEFIVQHNQLIEKQESYKNEKNRFKIHFIAPYKQEYYEFKKLLIKSNEELKHHNHKIKLHTNNIERLEYYITKYKEIIKEITAD